MLGHRERDAHIARSIQIAGAGVIQQAQLFDAEVEIVRSGPRSRRYEVNLIAVGRFDAGDGTRGQLPTVAPMARPGVEEHPQRITMRPNIAGRWRVEHRPVDRGAHRTADTPSLRRR